ncbi:15 kDa protein A-like [Dugong dugon]
MAGVWRALVLVVVLTVVACVAHRLNYEEIINQAVHFFNQGQRGGPLFRLLEATPPPRLNSISTIPLNFRIKETVCLSNEWRPLEECAFREGGEERNCTGNFFKRGYSRILTIDCTRDRRRAQEVLREKRSAESSEGTPPKAESSKLPPVVRDMYEKAKYDIISNILRNF